MFLDEIDKITARDGRVGGDVSREGVQRDLLPLIEGTTVSTKHGPVKTDHILFIASGAFHMSKPSDLLPELQGRLPIRVELKPLTRDDFRRILTEPEASLIKQYIALLATENVTLEFDDDAIDAIADVAVAVNSSIENIGARRLQTVMERVLDEISFEATDHSGEPYGSRRIRAEDRRRADQERRPEPVYPLASRFPFGRPLAYPLRHFREARSRMSEQVSKSGTPLGPIGTKVVFENEHIRVWSIELPGKGHQPLHEHDLPYLIVPISEGKSIMKWEDGRTRDLVDVAGEVSTARRAADHMSCSIWRIQNSTRS